jgi:hypothetical protein
MSKHTMTAQEQREIAHLMNDYNGARSNLVAKLQEVVDRLEMDRKSRTDKWGRSEAGERAQEYIDLIHDMVDELRGYPFLSIEDWAT